MSMGDSKVETVMTANGERRSRIPKKPLNQFVKSALLTLLKRDDIVFEDSVSAGSNTLTVRDSKGKFLFSYENAWDYGYYFILMANPKEGSNPLEVAEMDWFENDRYTNQQQQDIFDVFHAMNKRKEELQAVEKARQNLTPEEFQALKALGMVR